MSHYEERLTKDLGVIRERVDVIGRDIVSASRAAVNALLATDGASASGIILGDLRINREIREIDRLCHAFVARHLPTAGHLRFVSAVLRITVALERIGDYAVTVAREAVQLSAPPPDTVAHDIEMMTDQSLHYLSEAMSALAEQNADRALGIRSTAGHVASSFDKVFSDLMSEAESGSRPIKDLFALLVVVNRLERIRDQSRNICEETVFAATGETKPRTVYKVLFVDKHNSLASKLAEGVARKAFPDCAEYASAGWKPADALDPALTAFLDNHGFDPGKDTPTRLEESRDRLNDYDVIVGLEGKLRSHMEELPFHTVLIEWEIDTTSSEPEALHKQIVPKVLELCETLCGGAG